MKNKLVFENLIDVSTGKNVEIDVSTVDLDMDYLYHIASAGRNAAKNFNELFSKEDIMRGITKL